MNENNTNKSNQIWNTWMSVVNAADPLVEPGDYEAILTEAAISNSTSSGRKLVDVTYTLVKSGMRIHSYYMLDIPKGVAHLKRWAEILGYRLPNTPGDLAALLREISERQLHTLIRVIDNSGFVFGLLLERIDGKPEPVTHVQVTPVSPPKAAAQPHHATDDLL